MAFLGKCDFEELVKELEEIVNGNPTVYELETLIKKRKNYEDELVKEILELIKKNRIELECKKEQYEEEEKQRHFELERLRLRAPPSAPLDRNINTNQKNALDLHKIIKKFYPKDEISLYLVIFERQAKRAELREEHWVTHLLSFLPPEITQLIARESEQTYDNHVKEILLKRFK